MSLAKAVFERMCASGVVSGPVAEVDIDRAQTELGVVFPSAYREVLKRYGAVLIQGAEIYGLPDPLRNEPPLWINVVSVAKELQRSKQVGAEDRSFIPFSEDGTGVYFFFNTRASPRDEIWAIGPGVKKLASDDLYGFIVDRANGRTSP
jgi:hypothetical protein